MSQVSKLCRKINNNFIKSCQAHRSYSRVYNQQQFADHLLISRLLSNSFRSVEHQDSKCQFPSILILILSCDAIYNLPSTQTKRATTNGYGKKTDLDYGKHPYNKSPSPDRYQIDSFADLNKTHKVGWTAAIGR